jgi:predicted tellurium resistance membrane protein TerC
MHLANGSAATSITITEVTTAMIMIGMTLIAEGFGAHVPKGYVYAAMAFSAAIECLNIARRNRHKRLLAARQ